MSKLPTIRLLAADDVGVLLNVADDVFDNEVDPHMAAEFLKDPRHHIVVAVLDGRVIGMATGVHYIHPDKAAELWVNEVGVATGYRQQGIGRHLMDALFSRARELGCKEAWLGTEQSNTAARRLYAALGGAEETMVYVTFDLEKLDCDIRVNR